ncbi:MAG: hypothetical protein RBG13Loki_1883 [Promethearchaeota archaeon CR_4]|nr:MAG: hypothetical protein RBG13Loki_1883 [Candidatus Lokiarchaeota archaeon CR_4]
MKNDNRVKRYFEVGAKDFDGIYNWMAGTDDKPLKRLINKLFRKGMVQRVKLVLEECKPGKTILDIGCGSGRISLALAEKGVNVTGIDYSSQMIGLAKRYLVKYKNETKTKLNVTYVCDDFLDNYDSKEKFDVTLAIGVFDYIKDPINFHAKMKTLSKEEMIISYPAKYVIQMPIRKIWLWTKKCPVYFYTKQKIKLLYEAIGIKKYEIVKVSAGYLVKAHLSNQ